MVVMTIINNFEHVRYLFYTVGGIPKSVKFEPLETLNINDLVSEDQILYNSLDSRLNNFNDRFGAGFRISFSSETIPTSSNVTVQNWLNKINVDNSRFPSQAYVDRLTTAFDYADSQGITSELDLFAVFNGTVDTSLIPIIHSAGNDARFDAPQTKHESYKGTSAVEGVGYINTNWIQGVHGIKYSADSASIGLYYNDYSQTNYGYLGLIENDVDFNNITQTYISINQAGTTGFECVMNYDGTDSTFPIVTASRDIATGLTCFYVSANTLSVFKNGNQLGSAPQTIFKVSEVAPFFILGQSATYGQELFQGTTVGDPRKLLAFYTGSGNLNPIKMTTFTKMICDEPILALSSSTNSYIVNPPLLYSNQNGYVSSAESSNILYINASSGITGPYIVTFTTSYFDVFMGSVRQSSGFALTESTPITVKLRTGLTANYYYGSLNISNGSYTYSIPLSGQSILVNSNLSGWLSTLTGATPTSLTLKNLSTLIDGLITDGIYQELDLFHTMAGLETDEQRITPIKTNGSSRFTINATPTLSINGSQGTNSTSCVTGGYLKTGWIPTVNGVKFTQNSASVFVGINQRGSLSNRSLIDISDTNFTGRTCISPGSSGTNFALNSNSLTLIPNNAFSPLFSNGYQGVIRTASTEYNIYGRGAVYSAITSTSQPVSLSEVYIHQRVVNNSCSGNSQNDTCRMIAIGSGNVNFDLLRTRLNTFYSDQAIGTLN
jgi:hypothetical protein